MAIIISNSVRDLSKFLQNKFTIKRREGDNLIFLKCKPDLVTPNFKGSLGIKIMILLGSLYENPV